FGQTLSGLAIGAGVCGARTLSPCKTMGEQAGDGGAAGMIRTQHLSQKNPQRDQRRIDPIEPAAQRGQRLSNYFFCEDVCKRQVSILKKLASQKTRLGAKGPWVRIPHPCG